MRVAQGVPGNALGWLWPISGIPETDWLTDDKISEEEFRLILSEVDKYDQMKAEIRRGRQKEGGLPETEKKKKTAYEPHERRDDANVPWPALGRAQSRWKQWHLSVNISYSQA